MSFFLISLEMLIRLAITFFGAALCPVGRAGPLPIDQSDRGLLRLLPLPCSSLFEDLIERLEFVVRNRLRIMLRDNLFFGCIEPFRLLRGQGCLQRIHQFSPFRAELC